MSFWELLTGKSYKEYTAENVTADAIAMFPVNKVDKDIVKNLTSKITDGKKMVAVNFLDLLKNIDDKKNDTDRKTLWETYKQSHPAAAVAPAAAPSPAPTKPTDVNQPVVNQPVVNQPQAPASDNGPGGMPGGGKRKGRKSKTTKKVTLVDAPVVKRRRRRTIKVSAAAIDNSKPI
jgi:ribosomal protein S7